MAFLQLVLKARKVENSRQKYEDEKLTSIAFSRDAKPQLNWRQRMRRKKLRCEKQIKSFWNKVTPCGKNSWPYRKALSLRTDGTFENYVLKSVFGFFGGIVLTYIFFIFFVFQLNFKLSSAIFLCMVIGIILTLGLAFFHRVRCIVFLLLPQFFSKRGRQALMAYAFILALTGPVKNTLHNIGILSESLACGQEQLKQAVKNIVDLAKQPFYALGNAISKVIKTVKMVVQQIKQTLVAIKRLVLSIARVITSVFQWLGSIINICNKKLGTPFDRCQRVFDGAVADCRAKLGPVIGVICNLTYLVGALCYVVKPLDFICMLVSYVADTVVNAVRAKVKRFAMQMKAMFYVKIKFSHSFQLETNQSKSTREVSTAIITEIRSRADRFFHVFDWMRFITVFFIFFLLLKVMHYRHKWLTKERFDNKYITSDIRTIDIIRTRQDKETVLPLNPRERNKYIPLTSITLIQVEKVRLTKSAVFLGLATLKLIIYLAVDYSLYWILNAIRYHGRFQSKVERPNVVTVNVSGEGYLAELYRSIVNTFTPQGREMEVDTVSCLPTPIPPDFDKYVRIATLIIFSWLMAVFEPYGLRLRQVVMCQYYPDRAKQRAAWLYNHIIRSRGNFLKFARRQLRRKFGMTEGEKIERVTLRERLTAICPFLNILFPLKQNTCLLCGAIEVSDKNLHIKCSSPGCVGLFCTQCFADLQNICTICKSPIEYGDLSDMSEERDSSEDQLPTDDRILKYKPGKIDEEMELKRVEITEKKSKDEIDVSETEDIDRTSNSSYSYTYQDESAEEVSMEDERKPFKDVEAQKIRDDVTTRIFEEASITEASSDAETPKEHFAAREDKKFRARLKKKSRISSSGVRDSDSSTSIADTESWPTEEVDEEEVIRTEIEDDDDSKELLLKDRMTEEKLGRVNKLTGAVSRIPWLSKRKTSDTDTDKKRRKKRLSLVSKLIDRVQRKSTELTETISDEETKEYSSVSSSPFSLSDAEEDGALLKTKDRSTVEERPARKEFLYDYFIDRDSQIPCPRCEGLTSETENLDHPCRKEIATKELPRYLESVSQRSSYSEVDETKEQRARGKCIRQVNKVNALSDARSVSERMQKSLEYPVLKKYLPMYQSPELIEELKAHDRMRLIRKREAERRRLSSSPRKDDLVKRCRRENQDNLTSVERNNSVPASSKLTKKGMKLPYQETRAFRNLMHQLREKMRQRNEGAEQNVPLIQLSNNADKTKEVKQLFPLDDKRNRARSSKIVRKVTKKIVGGLKPYSDKGERSRNQERSMRRKLLSDEFCRNYTSDPEFLSDASSVCKCSGTTNDSNVPSEEGTTDNNESTR